MSVGRRYPARQKNTIQPAARWWGGWGWPCSHTGPDTPLWGGSLSHIGRSSANSRANSRSSARGARVVVVVTSSCDGRRGDGARGWRPARDAADPALRQREPVRPLAARGRGHEDGRGYVLPVRYEHRRAEGAAHRHAGGEGGGARGAGAGGDGGGAGADDVRRLPRAAGRPRRRQHRHVPALLPAFHARDGGGGVRGPHGAAHRGPDRRPPRPGAADRCRHEVRLHVQPK